MFFSSKDTIEYIRDDGLWMMLKILEEKEEIKIKLASYQKIRNWKDIDPKELKEGYHALTNPAYCSDVFSRLV